MNDACEKIKELTEDSWKDMLEQGLALKELPKVVPRITTGNRGFAECFLLCRGRTRQSQTLGKG